MGSADRRPARAAALVASVVLGFALVGCGERAGPSDPGATGSQAATPAARTAAPSSAAASPGGDGPTAAPTASPAVATLTPLVEDDRLLATLPSEIDGIALRPSPEAAAEMIADATLARSAEAIAVGMAARPGDSGGDDLVVATVVRLRPGAWSDAFFDDWRTTYDAAACAPAGGVERTDRRVIGTRTVDVADCVNGARTYHAKLAGDRLVSVTAVGERGYGDLVMAGLHE